MRAQRRFVVFGIFAALAAVACASVLGIEELAVRASDAAIIPPLVDAGGCVPSDATYCGSLCPPPDFCDDFEGQTSAFSRWNGGTAGAGVTNRVVDNPENVLDVRADESDVSNATPMLFASVLAKDNSTSLAFVGHELRAQEGRTPRGLRLQIQARLRALVFERDDASLKDQYVYAFGIGDTTTDEGAALVIRRRNLKGEVDLALEQRSVLTDKVVVPLGTLIDTDLSTLRNNWFSFDVAIGTESVLAESGIPCFLKDDDGVPRDASDLPGAQPNGLRLVVKIALASRCMALRNVLALGDWLARPNLVAGLAIGERGSAEIRLDNLSITFLY